MQRGTIRRRGRHWVVRFNEKIVENGVTRWHSVTKTLAPINGQYRSESDVRELADEALRSTDSQNVRPLSVNTFESFFDNVYMPHAKKSLKASSVRSYRCTFEVCRAHLNAVTLREMSVAVVNRILQAIADAKPTAQSSLVRCKNVMRAAMAYAFELKLVSADNSIADAKIPRGVPKKSMHAYTLAEIRATIAAIDDEQLKTALLVFAFTGLRLSEVKGLRWEDFDGETINVQRGVWNGKVSDTKSVLSKAPVPCIGLVADALKRLRKTSPDGYIFVGHTGKPLRFENELRRTMRTSLDDAGVEWYGWHAFRRGLGTNLHELGTPVTTTQAILRHSDIRTTMTFYIKTSPDSSRAALEGIESAFNGHKVKGRKTA
jgi:integrase